MLCEGFFDFGCDDSLIRQLETKLVCGIAELGERLCIMSLFTRLITMGSMAVFMASGSVIAQTAVAEQARGLAELKDLEGRIKAVVRKVEPATVSLASNSTGAWGSGVVVSNDGLILTAAHVVEGAKRVTVIFPNGDEAPGKVLGANRTKDVGMVQITKPGKYAYAELGDSDALKVTDQVIAMGHAGGFDPLRTPPVRFGRVVSKNISGFVTTDCTLIGGDSGGPLFDMEGGVVGINSSIGFDLKANNHAGISGLVADWERLKKGDTWGNLGANPLANPDSPVMGFEIGGEADGGVLVDGVLNGGPAKEAGIRVNDVIRAINGTRVTSVRTMLVELNKYRPGQEVKVRVKRGDDALEIPLTLMKRGDFYRR